MTPSDETLLSRYKAGDERAFRALVERYAASIYNLAFRFLRDPMEAENVTQETFLRVVSALDRVRLDRPFKPYLFRVAVNLCRDLARKKRPILLDDVRGDGDAAIGEAGENVEGDAVPLWERVQEQELHSRLDAAIGMLPPIYQAVVTLRYAEEFSYAEIAQTLDLPLNTVRTHLRRAKIRLRWILENDALPLSVSDAPVAKGGEP
jgi:RNA polymerase sigma-70 factor (ECF subfamily)